MLLKGINLELKDELSSTNQIHSIVIRVNNNVRYTDLSQLMTGLHPHKYIKAENILSQNTFNTPNLLNTIA